MSPERLLAAIMLVSLTFGAGLQVDWEHFVATLKNVGLLVRALIVNVAIVPLVGVVLAKLFRLPPAVATGFLLMAIAPGVPFVLMQVRKRGGRLGFAVALAAMLPLVSIVTVPLTAAFVLPSAATAQLPLMKFALTLVLFQLLPLVVGIAIGTKAPNLAGRMGPIVQVLFFIAVIALIIAMGPRLVTGVATVYGSNGMWAMLCLVIVSLAVGWAFGSPEREDRRVLSLGTALRNVGLCALLATSSFRAPQVAAAVLTYFIIQFVVTAIVGMYYSRTAQRAVA